MFSGIKIRKAVLAVLAGAAICIACPTAGYADWDRDHHWRHHHRDRDTNVVIAVPGLSIALGDDVFAERWNRSDYRRRSEFCHAVRHDCYMYGRYSRACHLKWRYCSPGQRDYGFYFNH
jgi:hypothetical protein